MGAGGGGVGPLASAARHLSTAASTSSSGGTSLDAVTGPALAALTFAGSLLGTSGPAPHPSSSSSSPTPPSSSSPAPSLPSDLSGGDLGVQVTLGGAAGFCSGYAVKKVGRALAVAIGLGFIAVQVARHKGVIESPDWGRVNERMVEALDADGDGKLTGKDAQIYLARAVEVLGFNVPGGAAFGTAFVLGLRYG